MHGRFMQIVSLGDNLHKMSKPIFCENRKDIINLSSAAFAHRVVNVKLFLYIAAAAQCFPFYTSFNMK